MQSFLENNVAEWKDNVRIAGLFSSLPPSQDVNPTAWNDKVTFWKRLLLESARLGHLQRVHDENSGFFTVSFATQSHADSAPLSPASAHSLSSPSTSSSSASNLSWHFSRKGLTPKCLPRIWELMIEDGDLQVQSKYTSAAPSLPSYAAGLLGSAIRRLSRSLSGYAGSPATPAETNSQKYILLPLLKETVQRFLDIHRKQNSIYYTNSLFTIDELQKAISKCIKTDDNAASFIKLDAEIAARYLEASGLALVSVDEHSQELVVKLKQSPNDKTTISSADIGVLTIRRTMKMIDDQIVDLNKRIDEMTLKAKDYVKRNQSNMAMRYLKSRKSLSNLLQQRSDSHFQLETVLLRLEHVQTESEIVAAYDAGAKSLSSLMKTHGLSVERIDETIDSLQEVLADNNEIQMAMSQAQQEISGAAGIEDADLEKELDALLEVETKKEKGKEKAFDMLKLSEQLPSVPASKPELQQLPEEEEAPTTMKFAIPE